MALAGCVGLWQLPAVTLKFTTRLPRGYALQPPIFDEQPRGGHIRVWIGRQRGLPRGRGAHDRAVPGWVGRGAIHVQHRDRGSGGENAGGHVAQDPQLASVLAAGGLPADPGADVGQGHLLRAPEAGVQLPPLGHLPRLAGQMGDRKGREGQRLLGVVIVDHRAGQEGRQALGRELPLEEVVETADSAVPPKFQSVPSSHTDNCFQLQSKMPSTRQ